MTAPACPTNMQLKPNIAAALSQGEQLSLLLDLEELGGEPLNSYARFRVTRLCDVLVQRTVPQDPEEPL